MKLVHSVEPGTIGIDIELAASLIVEQIKWLVEICAKPNELIANIDTFMISMRRHGTSTFVVDDQYSAGSFERQFSNEFHDEGKFGRFSSWFPKIRSVQI